MVRVSQILVPTDFSATSDAALDYARELAARFGARLQILHVVQDTSVSGPLVSEAYVPETPGVRTSILEDAKTRIAHRLTPRDREAFAASGEVVFGRGADTIVEYAADRGIDLIVMGTHGRTGVAHLLLGSVAERVVRTADCAVLTVRTPVRAETLHALAMVPSAVAP